MNSNFTSIETTLPGEAHQHYNGVIWYFKPGKKNANYFRTIKEYRRYEADNQLGTRAE